MKNLTVTSLNAAHSQQAALLHELKQITLLLAVGIRREDIVKQRRHTRYVAGRRVLTEDADVVLRDGSEHVVPASLLVWDS